MTTKNRNKVCEVCEILFFERRSDSNYQWNKKFCCSISCGNRSKRRVKSIFERLKTFQIIKNGCWGWSGCTDGKGYGSISSRNGSGHSPEKAHRVSYEMAFGVIPKSLYVCHKCDNPQCTNPDHLFIGTQKDNMLDCSEKNRLNPKSFNNLIAGAKGFKGAAINKNKV
jgi:hypothetical protein|tara:strand:+ start:87 stop:590 length:504 start_codon:yes stop_codon:yes gene_type:complete